uniref:Uncharacterized protein n=1 Tax=Corvus moneduloides TaxID=1196302 RepID=A0A8U7NVU4_CORMO
PGSPRCSLNFLGSFTVPWCPLHAGVPLSGVSVSAQPPGAQVALGDRLVLSCAVAAGTGPLSFSWHRGGSWAPLGTGPRLELRHVGDNDSGHYQCRATDPDVSPSVPSRGQWFPAVPGSARGCHCGLSLVAPPGWVTMGGGLGGPRELGEAPQRREVMG